MLRASRQNIEGVAPQFVETVSQVAFRIHVSVSQLDENSLRHRVQRPEPEVLHRFHYRGRSESLVSKSKLDDVLQSLNQFRWPFANHLGEGFLVRLKPVMPELIPKSDSWS